MGSKTFGKVKSVNNKESIIEERLRQVAAQRSKRENIEVIRRDKPIRASFSQERLWYLQQVQPNETSYNTYFAFKLNGILDNLALHGTLNTIIERHESLRTTFIESEGRAFQVINQPVNEVLQEVDLRNNPSDKKTKEFIQSIVNKPFSLESGPLFKAYLIRLTSDEHILLFSMHHIIFDGWSVNIFMEEFTIIYGAYAKQEEVMINPVKYQYADFSSWQRKHLTEEQMEKHLVYWEKKLKNAPQHIDLPYDKSRPNIMTSQGNLYKLNIPSVTAEKIRMLSKEEGTTLFMTLLTAFYILLYRYTGQEDIVIGSPTASRTNKDLESIMGFFVNMICLRANVKNGSIFRDVLRSVKETCVEAYSNQDLPFEKIIETLQPDRDLSRTPLFQVMFELQHGSHSFTLPDMKVKTIEDFSITAKYDLSVIVENVVDGSLIVNLEYATDLFEQETIIRIGENFKNILENIVDDPNTTISEIDILTPKERKTLLQDWTDTDKSFFEGENFFESFKRQVNKTPDNVAVVDDEGSFTYKELNTLSEQVSKQFLLNGVNVESVIGLFGNRDRNYLAGILGAMQIGAVYLPLDPSYPAQRINHIIRKSKCKTVLVTDSGNDVVLNLNLDENLKKTVEILHLNEISNSEVIIESICNSTTGRKNLAYTIFTSGSTGLPKGSMVEQGNMMNHLFSKIEDLELTSEDTVAQTASQCFDISIWQFLNILLVGGKVRIYNDDTIHNPYLLLEKVKKDRVTVMEFTPTYLKLLIEEASINNYTNPWLKYVLVTGEQAESNLLRKWLSTFKDTTIINAYGPSECADDVTLHKVHDETHLQSGLAEIGKPISNTSIYILDASLNVLPIGAKGEIYVGGKGVGRGYINDPKITASKYLPNHLSIEKGDRLFRTGDIGRFKLDGTLEFLGRIDNQVKIRGYRIELEEVEAHLLQHVSIRDAVVSVHYDKTGDKKLVAYVVPKTNHTDITSSTLKYELGETLPKHMVPSLFVFMKALPLSLNGKIERKSLPIPELNIPLAEYVPLTSETEMTLAEIWKEVLGDRKIGKFDHFFDVGGHSLLGIQVIARARRKFNVPIPVSCIFESPTLEGMAEYIDTLSWAVSNSGD